MVMKARDDEGSRKVGGTKVTEPTELDLIKG